MMLEKIDKKKIIIERLMQLYLHNISLYFPMDIDQETGLYIYDDLDSYLNGAKDKSAYIIKNDNCIAGFILADFTEEKNIVQEMFILNNFKRKGIGYKAIKELFDGHRGNWEIKSLPLSEQAELFWINIVKEYTNNKFEVEHIGKFNRAIITFNNK